MVTPGVHSVTDNSIYSCSRHTSQGGKQVVITMELDKYYEVDAVLLLGENTIGRFLSEFYIYVGFFPDHLKNTACPGGPYAYPIDGTYDTTYSGNA